MDSKKPKVDQPKRPKAEPRVSLAPLSFETALENLLLVQPDDAETTQTDDDKRKR